MLLSPCQAQKTSNGISIISQVASSSPDSGFMSSGDNDPSESMEAVDDYSRLKTDIEVLLKVGIARLRTNLDFLLSPTSIHSVGT